MGRRKKSFNRTFFFLTLAAATVAYTLHWIYNHLQFSLIALFTVGLFGIILRGVLRAFHSPIKKRGASFAKNQIASRRFEIDRQSRMLTGFTSHSNINDPRAEFIIQQEDYKRGLQKEREFLKRHKNFLVRLFDNRCAKCQDDENGMDIDHFFLPKNAGGCFALTHREGHLVGNAIPLCEKCNRSKSDKIIEDFFNPNELSEITQKLEVLNERLNRRGRPKATAY